MARRKTATRPQPQTHRPDPAKIKSAADALGREVEDLILHTSDAMSWFTEAYRPDLSTEDLGDDDELSGELARRCDAHHAVEREFVQRTRVGEFVSRLFTSNALGEDVESAIVADHRLKAIRAFFTDPQESYTVPELEAMFGDDLPDVKEALYFEKGQVSKDRRSVAQYLQGFVPPVVVGRALAGLPVASLMNETRAIELPQWLWSNLERIARKAGWSVSELLSSELLDGMSEIGFSEKLHEVHERAGKLPAYERIQVKQNG